MNLPLVLASAALAVSLLTAIALVVIAQQDADTTTAMRRHLLAHQAAWGTSDPTPAEPEPGDTATGPIPAQPATPPTAAMRAPGRHGRPPTPRPTRQDPRR